MRGIIVAVSRNGVIGVDNRLPWHYPADLKRFKRVTVDSTVIMGRKTLESMGKPLPQRRNIVVTSADIPGVPCVRSLAAAIAMAESDKNVWFIGGARIFSEAMQHVDVIDVTYVPDTIDAPNAVRFPAIDPAQWRSTGRKPLPEDPRLENERFERIIT